MMLGGCERECSCAAFKRRRVYLSSKTQAGRLSAVGSRSLLTRDWRELSAARRSLELPQTKALYHVALLFYLYY